MASEATDKFVIDAELEEWQDRWVNGPYKSAGDAQLNSPGDKDRIAQWAGWFKNNTVVGGKAQRTADIFIPWPGTGAYPEGNNNPTALQYEPKKHGNLVMAAAFYYMITGDTTYLTPVKAYLLALFRDPLMDASNSVRFPGFEDKNPGFPIAEMLDKAMNATIYVDKRDGWSGGEFAEAIAFFKKWGLMFYPGCDKYIGTRFVNWEGGNEALTQTAINANANSPSLVHRLYKDGPQTGWFTAGFNNRILAIARFVARAGIFCNDAKMQTFAKRMFKGYIKYAVFPGGDLVDMDRWRAPSAYEGSESGFNYSHSMSAQLVDMADCFARNGDTSLYDYSSEAGYFGTQSPGNPKSLLQVIQNLQKYHNGTYTRYGGNATTAVYNGVTHSTRIDGNEPHLTKGKIVFDVWFAMANKYYKNADVKSGYLRQGAGYQPYPAPSQLRDTGPNHPWGGQAAIYPGILLMYGQLEDVADPFGEDTPVELLNQTITFNPALFKTFGDAPSTLSATASSGLTVTLSLVSGPATLVGNTLTYTGAGTVVVKAVQAGNASYNPAPDVTQTITVNKAEHTITFPEIADKSIDADLFSVEATSSAGQTVTLTNLTPSTITLGSGNPGSVTMVSAGIAKIRASASGNANYKDAVSVERQFSVLPLEIPEVEEIVDMLDGVTRRDSYTLDGAVTVFQSTWIFPSGYTWADWEIISEGLGMRFKLDYLPVESDTWTQEAYQTNVQTLSYKGVVDVVTSPKHIQGLRIQARGHDTKKLTLKAKGIPYEAP